MFNITITQDETGQVISEYDKDAVSLISRHRTIKEALDSMEKLIYGDAACGEKEPGGNAPTVGTYTLTD